MQGLWAEEVVPASPGPSGIQAPPVCPALLSLAGYHLAMHAVMSACLCNEE